VVWYTARRLHQALAGRVLTRSDFRVPRYATVNLAGQTVTEAVARGKHLLIRTDGGRTVHTHLKMEGSWRVIPASEKLTESHKIRLVLANAQWQAVGYLLGITELLPTSEEQRATGHLGPDLLGPDWDTAEAVSRLTKDSGRPIGEALLDQANLAGIGNLYKSEVLFLRGVSPWTRAGDVKDPERMVELARRLLDANKARIGQVTTGDATPGRQTWVYGRRGAPCRRCGTAIRKRTDGADRITFWCPSCQPD
jgi:endonuclease VIII